MCTNTLIWLTMLAEGFLVYRPALLLPSKQCPGRGNLQRNRLPQVLVGRPAWKRSGSRRVHTQPPCSPHLRPLPPPTSRFPTDCTTWTQLPLEVEIRDGITNHFWNGSISRLWLVDVCFWLFNGWKLYLLLSSSSPAKDCGASLALSKDEGKAGGCGGNGRLPCFNWRGSFFSSFF